MSSLTNPLTWLGSSRKDFGAFPKEVQQKALFALEVAREGGKHHTAKPLKGFGNARTLEVRIPFRGSTYRVVYAIDPPRLIIVVHCYVKKSSFGISTPKPDDARVQQRLKEYFRDRYL